MNDQPATVEARIEVNGGSIVGDLVLPERSVGIVVFAHGSGSSRHSPRNRQVAAVMQQARIGTLLLDLLTRDEEAVDLRTAQLRFDIELLAGRVVAAIDWLRVQPQTASLPIGVFGASTGAAAALVAAVHRRSEVRAVVSRGGRPDLAGELLREVQAPTLLIVGGDDRVVIGMNEDAMRRMTAEVDLQIVPGATHLFEEPGALDQVADLAALHFTEHLR